EIGLRRDDAQIARDAIRDERLGAVDDVVVAIFHGARRDRGEIAPRAWLGHRDRGDEIAGDASREKALLLIVVSELVDVRNDDVRVEHHREAGLVDATELFADHARMKKVAAGASLIFGNPRTKESARTGFSPHVAVDHSLFAP